ncbi:hypothetical protein PL026_32315 [Pseudomonas extremaustralis]|nr:hypothetical protein [Pseudomonas extremaustralis]
MVAIVDLIGLLCVYGRALLRSRKRRMNTMETADHHLNVLPSQLLAAAARGEIDLNQLAAVVLAGRGLDHNATWVGFPAAARLLDQRLQA